MVDNFVVVFTTNNARVISNPPNLQDYADKGCAVNPDLSRVEGVPPHFWFLDQDGIRPMTYDERTQRQRLHEQRSVDNSAISTMHTPLGWYAAALLFIVTKLKPLTKWLRSLNKFSRGKK